MSERRRCVRFNANIDVKYEIPQSVIEGTAFSRDISANGMRLSSAYEVDEGTKMGLKILLPEEKPVFATGEVVWNKKAEDSGAYNIGLCFVKMDSIDRSRILDYIYKNWLSVQNAF